ncbi:MAG: hypothetical protein ACP5LS_05155 [Thermoprotei archaeon]
MANFRLKVVLVFLRPGEDFLKEEKTDTGYWGFVRSKKDYEQEVKSVTDELGEVFRELSNSGYSIEVKPSVELTSMWDLERKADDLRGTHVAVVLPLGGVGLYQDPDRSVMSGLLSLVDYVIVYDKFGEHIYSGTLFAPPLYQNLSSKSADLARRVLLAEGDLGLITSSLRAMYAVEKIRESTVVMVGDPNYAFGGWTTLAEGISKFGFKVKHVTYDQFFKDFQAKLDDESSKREAKEVADKYVANGKASQEFREKHELPEPDEERKLRAGIYYLTLRDYLKEADSDWITVNCLDANSLPKVKATPCMSHSIMNDEGIVAPCEADPTAMVIHYLMRWIANRPTAFYDPTVDLGRGELVLAHCTSPTKLEGFDKPPFEYVATTHHESNTAVAPKVLYAPGKVTVAGFSYDLSKLLVIRGEAKGPTFLRICRDQIEVKVGDAYKALSQWQGFHWVMAYGDYSRELEVLAKLKGIQLIEVS